MTTTTKRPVHLNLFQIQLPIAGLMSIIHRATGLLMFLATPALLWLLDLSLSGPEGFSRANELLHGGVFTLVVLLMLWALMHHLLAGIRYLLIDVHIGVDKPLFRQTAYAVTFIAPLLALILTGVLL